VFSYPIREEQRKEESSGYSWDIIQKGKGAQNIKETGERQMKGEFSRTRYSDGGEEERTFLF